MKGPRAMALPGPNRPATKYLEDRGVDVDVIRFDGVTASGYFRYIRDIDDLEANIHHAIVFDKTSTFIVWQSWPDGVDGAEVMRLVAVGRTA